MNGVPLSIKRAGKMKEYLQSLFDEAAFEKQETYDRFMSRADALGILDQIDDLLTSVPHKDLV